MRHGIFVLPHNKEISAPAGVSLLQALREHGLAPDAPCGGNGSCGKCRVWVNGEAVLACRFVVDRDMTVTVPGGAPAEILTQGVLRHSWEHSCVEGYLLAFDIGTTTVAGRHFDEIYNLIQKLL